MHLEVYSLMQMLNVELLGSASATRSLEKWCLTHNLAKSPGIIAQPVLGDSGAVKLNLRGNYQKW